MPGVTNRAEKAGERMGKAIVEMVHLMYQNQTAFSFYCGLKEVIEEEFKRRFDEMNPLRRADITRVGKAYAKKKKIDT